MKKILFILFTVMLLTSCNNESTTEKEEYYNNLNDKFKKHAMEYYKEMPKEDSEIKIYYITLADIESIGVNISEFKRYNSEELCDKYLSHAIITNLIDYEKYPDKKEAITVQLICEEESIYFN